MRSSLVVPAGLLALSAALQPQAAPAREAAAAGIGAASPEVAESPRTSRDPLAGAVLNRTVTVLGREFYQYFTATWRERDADSRYSISVHERPTAIRGSEMWVMYSGTRVFHVYLSPARAAVKQVGQAAADVAWRNVINVDVQRLMVQQTDLGPEEI